MFHYTWLILVMVAVFDASVWGEGDSNEPSQTPKPDGSDNLATCNPSEDPSLSTALTGNTKKQGSRGPPYTKKQLAETERFIIYNYNIFPIHERLRILYFYLVRHDARRLFQLFHDQQNPVGSDYDVCRFDENHSVVIAGVSMGVVLVIIVLSHYYCIWDYNRSIRDRPKTQRPKVHVPQARKLNVRPRAENSKVRELRCSEDLYHKEYWLLN